MIRNARISNDDCPVFAVGEGDFLAWFDGLVVFRVAVMGFEGGAVWGVRFRVSLGS